MVYFPCAEHWFCHQCVAGNDVATSCIVRPKLIMMRCIIHNSLSYYISSSPLYEQPSYVRFWTREGYIALLVMAVIAFMGGLLCYIYELQVRRRMIPHTTRTELIPSVVLRIA